MTARKKKGIGLIVSGAVSIVMGVVMLTFASTPSWAAIMVTVVTAVMSAVNIYFISPDTTVSSS